MTWTERFKLTWKTFQRIALPLYLWNLIFFFIVSILILICILVPLGQSLFPLLENMDHNFTPGNYDFTQTSLPAVPPPFHGFFGSYFAAHLPMFLLIFFLVFLIGLVSSSLLFTGTYHLAVKGLTEKASFKDFKLTGWRRLLSWYLFVFLIYALIILVGTLLGLLISSLSKLAFTIYLIIIVILFIGGSIFIIPWYFSARYYLLAQMEQSFGQALRHSWSFFRKNMGTLWGGFLASVLINIAIALIEKGSPAIGGILSLAAFPFIELIAIVWTVTLLREEREYLSGEPAGLGDKPVRPEDDCQFHSPADAETGTASFPEDTETSTAPFPGDTESEAISFPADAGTETPTETKTPTFPDANHETVPDSGDNNDGDEINYCSNCGSRVRVQAIYCSKCGMKLR
jgi:hypothetical protein